MPVAAPAGTASAGAYAPRAAQPTSSGAAVHSSGTAAGALPPLRRFPWQGVQWSVPYVAYLVYVFVIVSYRFPIGAVAAAVALISLPIAGEPLRFPPIMGWVVGFYLVAIVGYKGTQFSQPTWDSLIDLGKVVLLFWVALCVLTTRERIRFFIFFYLAVFAYYPVRGAIFNKFVYGASEGGRFAWNYVFENPNDLSALLFFPFGLALGVLVTESDKWVRRAALVGVAVMPLIMFLAQSRGAIIALFVAGVAMFFQMKGRNRMRFIVGAAAVGVVLAIFAPDSVWERLGALRQATGSGDLAAANDQNSARQRYEIWKVARKVFADHPALGVGWDAYPNAHRVYGRLPQFDPIARGGRDAHSTYLTATAETGIPGALMLIGIVLAAVIPAVRARRLTRQLLPGYSQQIYFCLLALFAFGVAAIFGSYLRFNLAWVQIAVVYVVAQQGLEDLDRVTSGGARLRRVS
jgi:O-antigen ligase